MALHFVAGGGQWKGEAGGGMCLAGCEWEASCGGRGAGTSLDVLIKRRMHESAEGNVWHTSTPLFLSLSL